MKKYLFAKIILVSLVFFVLIALYSCDNVEDNGGTAPNYSNDDTNLHSNYDTNSPTNSNDNSENQTVSYTVTTTCSTDDYGLAGTYTMINAKTYNVGDKIELSATVNDGYNFEGWYISDSLYGNSVCLSTELNYSYTMQSKNVTITPVLARTR